MRLKTTSISNLLLFISLSAKGLCEVIWVSYGWELFDYVNDARSASLGTANIAYNISTPHASIINPSHISKINNNVSLTHQSRFANMINTELIGFQVGEKSGIINLNIIYQGISKIPDTREMLLDWGEDGQFGTNDTGEGNGVIDPGERLDNSRLKFFNQYQLGIHSAFRSTIFRLPIGFGFKLLSYSLDKKIAIGAGLDIGYNKKINQTHFGIVIKNFPASGLIWEGGNVEGTSLSMLAGLSRAKSNIFGSQIDMNQMLGFNLYSSSANQDSNYRNGLLSIDGAYGCEIVYKKKIIVRIGKNFVNEITGGVGLLWSHVSFDYAFLSSIATPEIGDHHLLTINLSSDWISSKFNL